MRCPSHPGFLIRFSVADARRNTHGFTLVELLVASTIALGVMGAVATLFGIFSRTSSTSQSILDMTSRMRSTANTLRQDLIGVTAPLSPPLSPETNLGYFELIEGPRTDATAADPSVNPSATIEADTDDALLFTTRRIGATFQGVLRGTSQIEASTAEVAWFCRPSPTQPVSGLTLHNLYRRQLLVIGYVGAPPPIISATNTLAGDAASLPSIYYTGSASYDLSLRPDSVLSNTLVPNTLGDLTIRENRFMHVGSPATFPSGTTTPAGLILDASSTMNRQGEDVVLTNVISFDVRVFDPSAQPQVAGSVINYPGEPAYTAPTTSAFSGCWVDLGRSPVAGTLLTDSAAPKSGVTATYDTWSTHYETNGIDDDGAAGIDQGTNGADDNSDGVPDDANEAEVPPPYPTTLQAIEIRIRCYDPTSKEIRQFTVRHQFN